MVGNIASNKYMDILKNMPRPKKIDFSLMYAYVDITLKDKNNRIVKSLRFISRSPTKNFINLFIGGLNISDMVFTTVDGSTSSWSGDNKVSQTAIKYIAVGSGSGASLPDVYKMVAPISNGSGDGELVYGNVQYDKDYTVSGSSAYFSVWQSFMNSGSVDVNVSEAGIVEYIEVSPEFGTNNVVGNCLMWYDELPSVITVSSGQTLTLKYTYTINP